MIYEFRLLPRKIPTSGILSAYASLPLPDRNGRKLVGDWGGTTRGSFRIGGMLLVNGCKTPYTSAEIPPAGAPSGFDSAAFVVSALAFAWWCRSAQNDTVGMLYRGI